MLDATLLASLERSIQAAGQLFRSPVTVYTLDEQLAENLHSWQQVETLVRTLLAEPKPSSLKPTADAVSLIKTTVGRFSCYGLPCHQHLLETLVTLDALSGGKLDCTPRLPKPSPF